MTAAARPESDELSVQRATELLAALKKERFTGTLELHFLNGAVKGAKKTEDLMRQK